MQKPKPYHCALVEDNVRKPAFATVEADCYEDAFEKVYPQIEHLPDETEVAIYTERSGTGYHFNLGRWRPFEAAQQRMQSDGAGTRRAPSVTQDSFDCETVNFPEPPRS
jgi:hypothetical protein